MAPTSDPRPGDPIAQIVMVCRANIARSPLAMALLEAEALGRLGPRPDLWIRSAGVAALDGQPAASASRDQAVARGLDLSAHRAYQLTRDDVVEADLVITMSEQQRGHAVRLHPPAIHWTFTLPELARLSGVVDVAGDQAAMLRDRIRGVVRAASDARPRAGRPGESEDVADPFGGPAEGFEAMAGRVEADVQRISGVLFGQRAGRT